MHKKLAERLDTVHSVIGATLKLCAKEKEATALKTALKSAVKEINETVIALANSPKSRSLIKTRKSLVAIENTFDSLHGGLVARELKVKDFRAACSTLEAKFVPNFVKNLTEEVLNLPKENNVTTAVDAEDVSIVEHVPVDNRVKEVLAAGGKTLAEQMASIKRMLKEAPVKQAVHDPEDDVAETEEEKAERLELEREADRLRREGQTDASSIETLMALRKKRSGLPTRLTKLQPFTIVKLPLVPVLVDNPFVVEGKGGKFERTMAQLAMKYSVIQGYPFLEEQLILCVSRSDIENANIRHKEDVKEVARFKVKGVKSSQKKAETLVAERQEKIDEYLDTLASLAKRKASMEQNNKPFEKQQREIINEIRAISKAEYERVLLKEITRRASYMELSEADQKHLARISLKTGHKRLTSDEMKARGLDSEEAASHYASGVQKVLTKAANAEIATLKSADKAKLAKLIVQLVGLREKVKPYILYNKRVSDLGERIKNARVELAQFKDSVELKEEGIKAIRKAAKPKLNDITPIEYAMNVLAHINEISHSNYQPVVQEFKVNVRNADILCFWIMPAAKLQTFLKLGSSKAKIQWAFPWDA